MTVQKWMMPWLKGGCFDFALALAEQVDAPQFVAVGNPKFPEHVALRIGDLYADVRGLLGEQDFLAHHAGKPIIEVERDAVELHCGVSGMKPPYKGVKEIAAARKAVKLAFPSGLAAAVDKCVGPPSLR